MPANTLFIDDRHRAHIMIVPPAPAAGQHPFREPPFVLITGRLREGRVIEISHRKLGPYLRARGSFLERALRFVDVETLAADLDATLVETKEEFEQAVAEAKSRYETQRLLRQGSAIPAAWTLEYNKEPSRKWTTQDGVYYTHGHRSVGGFRGASGATRRSRASV
jgi:hypothetical protein